MDLRHRSLIATLTCGLLAACSGTGKAASPTSTHSPASSTTVLATTTSASTVVNATTSTSPTTLVSATVQTTTVVTSPVTSPAMQVGAAIVVKVGDQWVVQMGSIPTVPLPTSTAPNPNLAHIVRPEDTPILEAYVKYITALHQAYSQNPIEVERGDLFDGLVTATKFDQTKQGLAKRRDAGQSLQVSQGLTIRPFVISDPRSSTEATVLDCQLDGSYFIDVATGQPSANQKTAIRQFSASALLVLVDGKWVVDRDGFQGGACLPE